MVKIVQRLRALPITIWFAYGLILMGAALRVLRHFGVIHLPPNVAPVSAMAMFSGAYLGRRSGLAVPIGLMLISDLLIGFDTLPITVAIYACFVFSGWLGSNWRRRGLGRLTAATISGSLIFFLVTNAAVWAWSKDIIYPHTLNGLWQAYLAGLPFLRNTLIGDLGYTAAFFGVYELIVVYSRRRLSRTSLSTTHG